MSDRTDTRRAADVRHDRASVAALVALAAVVLSALAARVLLPAVFARLRLPGAVVTVLVVAWLLDVMRRKNVVWRFLRRRCGPRPDATPARGKHAAGRGRLGVCSYWGLRCFGTAGGLLVVRLLPLNRPLFLPWSAIAAVEASPGALTGRTGFETDMDARIELRDEPGFTVELPWLEEFRALLPKRMRYRKTKAGAA